uniref:Uncharacterized protein n=1 Tax=Panagrolaimus superbus TaxID=310955 RepID=A0A914YLH1_9BILA
MNIIKMSEHFGNGSFKAAVRLKSDSPITDEIFEVVVDFASESSVGVVVGKDSEVDFTVVGSDVDDNSVVEDIFVGASEVVVNPGFIVFTEEFTDTEDVVDFIVVVDSEVIADPEVVVVVVGFVEFVVDAKVVVVDSKVVGIGVVVGTYPISNNVEKSSPKTNLKSNDNILQLPQN